MADAEASCLGTDNAPRGERALLALAGATSNFSLPAPVFLGFCPRIL
jgi:hypothetical protein